MKLVQGRVAMTGAPVRSIWWSVDQEEREVEVQIDAERSIEVKETYLDECLEWVSGLLDLFVLGKVKDATE